MTRTQIEKQMNPPAYSGRRPLNFHPFTLALRRFAPPKLEAQHPNLAFASLAELQALLSAGSLTSRDLALYFIERIRRLDAGRLNSVLELNPDALAIAAALDEERRELGSRGPLHGIPVLIKDNIGSAGRLHTAAGAKALEPARCDRDAFIVQKLRQAGALILGKTNLSEWANLMSQDSSNGFSVLGGQARNPLGDFDVGGSSSGSGAALAAGLIPLAVGTETAGSLVSPASSNGVCTLKPSLGLISRDRIIPISEAMDTAGPMARSLPDLCALLNVLAGPDPNDPVTARAAELAGQDFTRFLDPDGLRGVRLGLLHSKLDEDERRIADEVLRRCTSAGAAEVVDVEISDDLDEGRFMGLLCYDLRRGVDAYLQATAPGSPLVRSLAEVVSFNQADPPNRAPYGQAWLEQAVTSALTQEEYAVGMEALQAACRQKLEAPLHAHRLDLIVSLGNDLSGYYAPAGWPALCVPAGKRSSGAPLGATFVGRPLEDGKLIAAGYAFLAAG